MSDPINPNFKSGVGRLATDRYDFENHIEGKAFNHNASAINLSPHITINSSTETNVQDALANLATALNPPVVQDATTSQKGIIQLTGDITGTSTNVRVVGLRGYPVNSSVPALNNVLTWNGTNWGPAVNASTFVASQDLAGTSISQTVINLSGNAGTVTMSAANLTINSGVVTPIISQAPIAAAAQPLVIQAQSTTTAGQPGGYMIVSGGNSTTGTAGGVVITTGIVGGSYAPALFTLTSGGDGYFGAIGTLTIAAPTTINAINLNSATNHYTFTSRSLIRMIGKGKIAAGGSNWTVSGLSWTAGNAFDTIFIPINLPNGAVITGATMNLIGAGGHSALPASMPSIQFARYDFYGASSLLGTAGVDPSINTTAYQSNHTIPLTGQSIPIDNTSYVYYLGFISEGSTNFVAGLQVFNGTITFTTTYLDEA